MKKALFLLLSLLSLSGCGSNSNKGQVIPGTDGITVERCNEIISKIPDPAYFSQEFGGMVNDFYKLQKDQGDSYLASLLGGLGDDEFMYYWTDGNGEGFTENAQKTYSLVSGSKKNADILLDMSEVFHDDYGNEIYDLHKQFHMIFVKENGTWMLDDWRQTYGGEEWHSRKQELKEYIDSEKNTVYISYDGHLEDENDPKPFKVFLAIDKEENDDGNRDILGAFRFNDKGDEYYDALTGSLEKDGRIHFYLEPDEYRGLGFWGTISPDFNRITGDYQVYSLQNEGRMVFSRDFLMNAIN